MAALVATLFFNPNKHCVAFCGVLNMGGGHLTYRSINPQLVGAQGIVREFHQSYYMMVCIVTSLVTHAQSGSVIICQWIVSVLRSYSSCGCTYEEHQG